MKYYPPNPKVFTRDTAQYFKKGSKKPSLKSLVEMHLGESIQSGEHSSVEDARATMEIYVKFRDEWEESLINPNPAGKKEKVVQQNKEKENKLNVTVKSSVPKGLNLSNLPTDHVFQSSDLNDAKKNKMGSEIKNAP